MSAPLALLYHQAGAWEASKCLECLSADLFRGFGNPRCTPAFKLGTMQILLNTVGLICWVRISPFNTVSCYRPNSEIPDIGFAMSALFPSLKSGPKAVLCVVLATVLLNPRSWSTWQHGFKRSAAVCASLSTKALDYSIFRLITHKSLDFAAFSGSMQPKAQYLYFVCSTWTPSKMQLLSAQTHKTSSTTAEDPCLLFCSWRVSTYLGPDSWYRPYSWDFGIRINSRCLMST